MIEEARKAELRVAAENAAVALVTTALIGEPEDVAGLYVELLTETCPLFSLVGQDPYNEAGVYLGNLVSTLLAFAYKGIEVQAEQTGVDPMVIVQSLALAVADRG